VNGSDRQVMALTTDASDSNAFFLTYRDRVGSTSPATGYELAQYRYFAQRWSAAGGDVHADRATNLPGQIVRSWKSGSRTLLITEDQRYTWVPNPNGPGGYFDSDPRLHLLERIDDATAVLRDSYLFTGRALSSLVGDGDRLFVTSSKGYNYGYAVAVPAGGGTTSTVDNSDELTIFDASSLTLARAYDGLFGLGGVQAMGAQTGRLYLNVSGSGVLVLDVTDPTQPFGRSFLRTLGWGSHLEFSGSTLYVAAGNFGVFQKTLDAQLTLSP
jgi:hypothetical protein